jgi:hypothetical protein
LQFVNRVKTVLQYAGRFALIARSNRKKSHPYAVEARVGFLFFRSPDYTRSFLVEKSSVMAIASLLLFNRRLAIAITWMQAAYRRGIV